MESKKTKKSILMRIKMLLDTDGSDIDDAVYLAYLPANPNCELKGWSS